MDAISHTAARTNLAKIMEQVCEDHAPVIITRSKSPAVVMISLEDYEALQETDHLLRAPKNAHRLPESVAKLERLRRLLDEGEESGMADYSYDSLIAELDNEAR